ncbi:MAG: phosphate signaling complex protein PhoU [Streptosporangiales bacterium]|nr:phosphate signaling complex protein PhoU [Streptosporangiales bacterium]MBO0892342.1 phosphate signaling complex protein PhoU [Acidothermales bacterium]
MRDAYKRSLDSLRADLVEMTVLVHAAMDRATTALLDTDGALAEQVIEGDTKVDQIQMLVEEASYELLARQQPVASDLRAIVTAIRISADLERMGDNAVHVAEVIRRRYPDDAVPPLVRDTVAQMANVASRMSTYLEQVVAQDDIAVALQLETADDEMDALLRQIFVALLSPRWTYGIEGAVDVTLVGRYLERYADHAVAVGRRVVYLVTGSWPVRAVS